MKLLKSFITCLGLLATTIGFSQPHPVNGAPPSAPIDSPLTKFNLDFPGGSPSDLVAAIQKATGKPLNVILDSYIGDIQLPPLKMNMVDVEQLFSALLNATLHYEVTNGYPTQQAFTFKTNGKVSDDSVWYGVLQRDVHYGQEPEKTCRFYLLTPYLEKGLAVDDITTAIQTGWKLLGKQPLPSISYHKETKLLIAVGEGKDLAYIDEALRALRTPQGSSDKVSVQSQSPIPANK
jgi:hypothetical protein